MECNFSIYDNEKEEWIGTYFASLEGAEDYMNKNFNDDYERYTIWEKIS